jgi:hypothetical protein
MPNFELTDARLRRITLALAIGLVLGVLLYLAAGKREESSFIGGDFPAFYAAAEIVWSGRGADLYDYKLQRELENRHWPDFSGNFYVYAYPPFFALLLSPLAALSPLVAEGLASALLFASLLAALALTREVSPFVRRHFLFSLIYLLTLVPLEISIVGVQNTALSILCFAFIHWASQTERPLLTGLGASLLLYKPQLGALLFLFLMSRGRREELMGWGFGALVLYLLGTLVLGAFWPLVWAQEAAHFGEINFTINDHMITLAGVMYWIFENALGAGARGLPWAYALSTTILLLSILYARRDEKRFALVPYLVLFLSPQSLYYDLGIAVFCFLRDLRPGNTKDFMILGAIWLYSVTAFALRRSVSFPLFAVPLVAIFWIHFRRIREQALHSW